MESLVYYVSFNSKEYYENTAMSIETLIKVGGYQGDIKILTDIEGFDIKTDHKRIEFINCKNKINEMVEHLINIHGVRYFRNIKSSICHFVDITKYDAVLYLDSDVLINNPITKLITLAVEEKKIIVQRDDDTIDQFNMKQQETIGYSVLTDDQISYLHGNGFCTGIVCLPRIHYNVLIEWQKKNLVENFLKSDQGNFHWVIADLKLLNEIKYIKAIPFNEKQKDKIFLHYWVGGTNKNKPFNQKYEKLIKGHKK